MSDHDYYRLATGVDVVPLAEQAILFRSSTLAIKIDGSMADLLGRQVLPMLDRPRTLSEISSRVSELPAGELRESLDSLVRARVLERRDEPAVPGRDEPFDAFVESLGVPGSEARARLASARIAFFGLEAHGAHLALELARLGLGSCVLADPFEVGANDELLMPPAAHRPGRSRQAAVAEALREQAPETKVTLAGELSRESVQAMVESCTLLVGCFDRGYETAHHWLNRAAVALRRPALFSELRSHVAILGPCVHPGETACYMCYRMRRVACEDDYESAMAHERFLNARNRPSLSSRATAPQLPAQLAGLMTGEILKLVVLGLPSGVAGRILEVDSLTLESRIHAVLQQPECPVCGAGPGRPARSQPGLEELRAAERKAPSGDLHTLAPRLVSPRTGVVRRFEPFVKDAVEPAVPYIVRADVANHQFVAQDHDNDVCSGKGLTLEDARVSALGEAVERYSGGVYRAEEVRHARRSELTEASLDPRALVLYDERQYPGLPYARYEDNRLGWVPARALVGGGEVLVPAMAVFMNYRAREDGEFLFPITSNGLAAGPTLLDAVWRAACEVLERDSFMIAWLNRLPARRFAARAHPEAAIARLADSYARRGVEIRLYRMPCDHDVATFAAIALEGRGSGGPAAVVGLGADPDPVRASAKAVLEVCQVRPALRRRLRRPEAPERLRELLDDPRRVSTIDDHDLLYASHESLHRLGFWLDAEEEAFPWGPAPAGPAADALQSLVAWLGANGRELLYVNLTPPDMAALGLYTARAIVPEFQPIDFGWKERRLGGARARRLPVALGLRAEPASWDDLNHDPHPLA